MTTTVRAAVHRAVGRPLSLETIELGEPRDDEIRVRMVATGVCHTDVKIMETDYLPLPVVLGHEGAGIVAARGAAVTDLAVGDAVVLSIDFCGACRPCLSGSPAYCDEMFTRHFSGARADGTSPLSKGDETIHGMFFAQSSFATEAIAPARAAVKVPTDAPLELLGPLGCGVQTGAGVPLNMIHSPMGCSIAVFGSGSVGLSAIAAAQVAGMHPIVAVDRVPERLDLAREFGATHVVDTSQDEPAEAVRAATRGGVDYAFDNTGVLIAEAFAALHAKGQLMMAAGWEDLTFPGRELLQGKSVRGVLEGDSVPRLFIPYLIDLHRRGRLPLEKMVREYAFDDIQQAVIDSDAGRVVKPVLRFDG